ncbi:hypothetical protein EVB91_100 [Rhizobium phage RHph_I1_18]|nr:hypothetical protein EVB91_100 [Rhizobium phage RHph_I1_18]
MTNQLSKRQIDEINLKGFGKEPTFDGKPLSVAEIARCYTWYRAFNDKEDAIRYLKDHCKDRPALIKAVENTSNINETYGYMARMLSRGANLGISADGLLDQYLLNLSHLTGHAIVQEGPVVRRSSEKHDQVISDFEEAVDKLDPSFDGYKYLSDNSVSQALATKINAKYTAICAEIQQAIAKKDQQVVEAYSNYRSVELKKLLEYHSKVVNSVGAYLGNIRKVRKPRKAREKRSEQVLKHFKYCVQYADLQLASIDPMQIRGSQMLFTFNVTTNVLSCFVAKDSVGLQIHRSSISNYDEARSQAKRVGKRLQTVLPIIMTGSKKARGTVMDTLKTEPARFTDRINTNVVLLKGFK